MIWPPDVIGDKTQIRQGARIEFTRATDKTNLKRQHAVNVRLVRE
jgi:hypothetical protein